MKLIGPDGEEKIACSVGTGPVDAAYKAVDQIIQVCCHHNFDFSCTGTLLLTMEYGCWFFLGIFHALEGQAWCSGESCLTESPGRGFEAASPQILRGEGLPRFFPYPDPTHVGAFGTGSTLFYVFFLLYRPK